MKRYNNLYNFDLKDITDVYKKQIRVNTKNKYKIKKFEDFYAVNIYRIKKILDSKNYKTGKYNIFLIKEPKYRIIMSQKITDKVINHLVANNILLPILDKSLIDTNVATRKGKGTHYGIKYLKKALNSMNGTIYALKFDISKYFYNINHAKLIELLKNKISDKDALNILITIIDSTNSSYVNKTITAIKESEYIYNANKEINKIPLYKKGKGLPIGNMTSQIMAIFYLNELDHYIKEKLHIKYYLRYMDDGVLLSNDKVYLRYCLDKIKKILKDYDLELNHKTKIINVSKEGLVFLGFRFYKNSKVYMKVRNETKRRFKRKLNNINMFTKEYQRSIINSYSAHLKWGNCFDLYNNNLKRFMNNNYE